MKVLVPLAPGFEEIEAVTIVDVLRRAEIEVTTAYTSGNPVTGSHGITVAADIDINDIIPSEYGMIALPGGMPGSTNLRDDKRIIEITAKIYSANGFTAAVCAAPIVLAKAGLLENRNVTCYPGFESMLDRAVYLHDPVVTDGRIITGKGPGCAIPFALKLVEIISGKEKSEYTGKDMQPYRAM